MRIVAGLIALALALPASAQQQQQRRTSVDVHRSGASEAKAGPAEYFTGRVRVENSFAQDAPARVSGATVTFEPGARTAWHTHPLGQTLFVTAGVGWYQRDGGPTVEIRPGDVVVIPPQVKHWHGATRTSGMTHIAVAEGQDGKVVDWLEQVSDTDYRGPA